uniref:Carboxylesterase 6 n=1 Tax=Holotrichia parallela TaxID=93412 RepID=A0A6G7SK18_HOLPA|nr:carboxylesterase 6 [Holotrichia parallela]
MRFLWLVIVFCAVQTECGLKLHSGNRSSERGPSVKTPLGRMRGSVSETRFGRTIYNFKGVRYAEAPVGHLRFKPPVPVSGWNGIYDATRDPPGCPQPDNLDTSEDCLFLNVFTTELKCETPGKPVMVFFHPGGFYEGSCNSSVYGPQYLLDKDVVLVVPNYRLGSLGFLSTGTKEAPGNNGMKDQVAVLKWVKDNISSFCGNPNLVTIFGYSAGGLSVTAHLVSPLSRGLFHRAISMSGSILGNLPIYTNQSHLAKKQAQLLNCPDSSATEIIACLNTKTAKEIGDSLYGFDEFLYDPIWIWTPVIEPDFGQERFLIEHPIDSVKKGDFAKVPVMMGITTDEFGSRSFGIMLNETVLETFDKDYLRVWPIIYTYERNPPLSETVSKGLRKFYFPDGIDSSSRRGVAELYADGVIGFGTNRGVKLLSKYNTKHVYYYLFNYHGRYTHAYYPNTNNTLPYGVSHHDDLLYLFYVSVMTPLFNQDPEDRIVNKMIQLWSNFAQAGNPIPNQTYDNFQILGSITWPPFTEQNQTFMDISTALVAEHKLYEDRYRTWENLLPL